MKTLGKFYKLISRLPTSRKKIYENLSLSIGDTPLHEIKDIPLSNGNRIFAKEEYKNPSGSHYDRVYLFLLADLETQNKISPDIHHLIETTSGCAGAAFARICGILGYECSVVVPDGLPKARIDHIKEYNAKIILSPKEDFIAGAVRTLKKELTIVNKKRIASDLKPYVTPNHSRDTTSVLALEPIAIEALSQAGKVFDYFIAAAGNGISILGPSSILKKNGTQVIAWDPLQAPTAYNIAYPDVYKATFGLDPGQLGQHHIYGTGVLGVRFLFLEKAIKGDKNSKPVVDEVMLVADEEAFGKLSSFVSLAKAPIKVLEIVKQLPDLSDAHKMLNIIERKPVGYSSAGSFAVALELCKKVKNKSILIIFYDDMSKY